MALFSLGDSPVLAGIIQRPLRGAWTADLAVDGTTGLGGQATITGPGISLVGTIVTPVVAQVFSGRRRLRVVGGAYGLRNIVPARWYTSTTVKTVASDILTNVGEKLSASSDAGLLAQSLPAWARFANTAEGLLDLLLATVAPNAIWRTLSDGSIWIGTPTWPAATVSTTSPSPITVGRKGDEDIAEFAGEDLSLDAGVTLQGRRVGLVRHIIDADAIRTEALWTDGA